jgi:hypothetical protein
MNKITPDDIIPRWEQTEPHDHGSCGVCGGDLHQDPDGEWVLYDHHLQVVEALAAKIDHLQACLDAAIREMEFEGI